jgi:3-methylcrotonyl-CoA carboxylase alpha subunit
MIAKLIAYGEDRDEAIDELAAILEGVEVWPVRTNAAFLANALLHADFVDAKIYTGFIARLLDDLVPDAEPSEYLWRGAALVALAVDEEEAFADLAGFRLNAPPRSSVALGRGGKFRSVDLDGEIAEVSGFRDDNRVVVFSEGQAFGFDLTARGVIGAAAGDGAIIAPMPGKVTSVEVAAGDKVTKGQRLLTLEAMKMEHGLVAPFDGTVAELNASEGAQVQVDALLAKIDKAEE